MKSTHKNNRHFLPKALPVQILYALLIILLSTSCHLGTEKDMHQRKQLETRFLNGDRDTSMLKELFKILHQDSSSLAKILKAKVADAYLCTFPIQQRYEGERETLFVEEIHDLQLQSYREFILNWNKLEKTKNNSLLLKKIDSDAFELAKNFLESYVDQLKIPANYSFKELSSAYLNIQVIASKEKSALFNLLQAAAEQDVHTMIKIIEDNFIQPGYYPGSFSDLFLYNGCLRIVLDLSSKQQCEYMLTLLSQADSMSSKKRYSKMIFDFSGKLKYIEYYTNHEK